MKDYEDEAFDELEKAQQRKVATGVTDGSKTEANSTLSALKLALEKAYQLGQKLCEPSESPYHDKLVAQEFNELIEQACGEPAEEPAKQEHVAANDMTQERVDETGKKVHEVVICPYCYNSHTLGAVYFDQNCSGCVKRMSRPLAAQPSKQERKPLTDEQIAEITVGFYGSAIHHDDYEFARAIEAAHGIHPIGFTSETDFKE
jgi:hypothetical protein